MKLNVADELANDQALIAAAELAIDVSTYVRAGGPAVSEARRKRGEKPLAGAALDRAISLTALSGARDPRIGAPSLLPAPTI